MASITVADGTIDGFAALTVDTGALALTIMPALGGKVSSLRDLRSGREWLWRNPRLPYRPPSCGMSYVAQADTGGWDECFPTVAPCAYPTVPWAGVPIIDHGELWAQPAALTVSQSQHEVALHSRWQGAALPYTFERSIKLAAGSARLRVAYAATSESDAPLPFIWSMHPLLAIAPGMRLALPPEVRFNRWLTLPADLLAESRGLAFPPTLSAGAHAINLGRLPAAAAAVALKLWSDPLPQGAGWASVVADDGALQLRWDTLALPQVALWLNLGAWAGDGGPPYYNLGLEPCIGAQDSLADAVTGQALYATLPARGTRSWSLEIELRERGMP